MSATEQLRLKPGDVVILQGLTSEFGRIMNGQPGVVVRYVPQHERYEVVTPGPTESQTVALKAANLRLEPRRFPIPQKQERGNMILDDGHPMSTLAELLVRKTDNYTPSDTMLQGYAAMALGQIDMDDRRDLSCLDMEQCAGIMAIARMCVEGEEMAAEECLAVLLQRESMHLDVITLLLTQTPYFGPPEEHENSREWEEVESSWNYSRYNAPTDSFTPDQTHSSYIKFMSVGPLLFLKQMSRHSFCSPVFAVIQRIDWYHLIVRRFLRIIAREAQGEPDGRALGKMCRQILPHLVSKFDDNGEKVALVSMDKLDQMRMSPISSEVAKNILDNVGSVLDAKGSATSENLESLCRCKR